MSTMYEQTASLPEERPGNALVRLLAFLGPDFTFFLFFLGVFVTLGVVFGSTFHVAGEGSIVIVTGLAGGLVGVRFVYRARAIVMNAPGERDKFYAAAKRILRDWGPMILLVVLFENLHQYTGLIRKIPIDEHLYNIDVAVFGVEPSVWVGKHIATPLLTDWFAMAYGMYFILPMILATMLSFRGRRADFRELATSVVLHLCIGFTCFILFPAGPPRFYSPLMHGGFDPPHLTSFPSMHCAIAMMTLLYGWRFGSAVFPRRPKLFFWLCLPIVVSLWFSTIYLRHHWVPDCIAGMVLGICCYRITPVVRRIWPGAEAAVNT